MKENWIKIMGVIEQLRKFVGNEEIDDLVKLKNGYWELLLETRSTVKGLMASSKIQKQNVDLLLGLLDTFKKNKDEFSHRETKLYNECIDTLSKWIDQEKLVKLLKDWKEMIVLEFSHPYDLSISYHC